MKKHLLPFIFIILLVVAAVALGAVREIMENNISSDSDISTSEEDTHVVEDEQSEAPDDVIEIETDTDQKLVGKTWTWISTTIEGEGFITPQSPDTFTLTFTEDGSVSGTTDCNNFFGNYERNANKISFGPLAQTLMFCEGSQESEFIQPITEIDTYQINDEGNLMLTLNGTEGLMLFQ